jgi:hypothetical protein
MITLGLQLVLGEAVPMMRGAKRGAIDDSTQAT